MAENKMAQVAQMFGKELGEEFYARLDGNKCEIKCRFTKNGLEQSIVDGLWNDNDRFFKLLLIGRAEIVEDE
jgi:hypothetical protein